MDATLPRLAIKGASRLAQHMWPTDFSAKVVQQPGRASGAGKTRSRRNKGESERISHCLRVRGIRMEASVLATCLLQADAPR